MRGRGKRAAWWLALPLVLALAGCGVGRTGAPTALFDLGPETAPASNLPLRGPVAMTFASAQMLADTGVIWRVGDSDSLQSYATYRWASSPAQLVQQRLTDRLSAEGPVLTDNLDASVPLLQVSLTRFEQVYAADGTSSAGQVVLQAVLIRDRHAVDSLRLVRSAPAPTQDASGGVQALRAATDTAANDLAVWLAARVPARTAPAGLSSPSSASLPNTMAPAGSYPPNTPSSPSSPSSSTSLSR